MLVRTSESVFHGKTVAGIDTAAVYHGKPILIRDNKVKILKLSRDFSEKYTVVALLASGLKEGTKAQVKKFTDSVSLVESMKSSLLSIFNEIAKGLLEALTEGKGAKINQLVRLNQSILEGLGIKCKEVDEVLDYLRANKLEGKISGAGGGGYIITIVPKEAELLLSDCPFSIIKVI